ncbi:MAG: hypothetical protein OXC37_01700 [Bdellovibrionaceae bacterium]|nr:hypothetical protein [Pseudobdellovibrionaceae bacterium]
MKTILISFLLIFSPVASSNAFLLETNNALLRTNNTLLTEQTCLIRHQIKLQKYNACINICILESSYNDASARYRCYQNSCKRPGNPSC